MRHSDVLQLGGSAVIDRTGVHRCLHRATRADDHAPVAELLAAAEACAAG